MDVSFYRRRVEWWMYNVVDNDIKDTLHAAYSRTARKEKKNTPTTQKASTYPLR
jgi:hypothetical protein